MIFIPQIVILHCSATPDYQPNDPGYDRFRAKDIDKWHKARGWKMIGYHYVITRAGVIETGRPITDVGAHCESVNKRSIGVCYIGTKFMLSKQITALKQLSKEINLLTGINLNNWHCHNEFDKHKVCPGFSKSDLDKLLTF
jgi:N-acetyl-anhydromuramyl-L-alanine amidase AmpD